MALEQFNPNVVNPDIDEPIWEAYPNTEDWGTTVFGQPKEATGRYQGAGSFLGDILGEQGWYMPQPGSAVTGGGPSTEQERNFILDFMLQNQRAPTLADIGQWKQGVDTSKDVFTHEGLMGQMGFRTQKEYVEAQSRGETYGPHELSAELTGGGQFQPTKPMTPEEALAGMGVAQSYPARLRDYLDQLLYEDQPRVDAAQKEVNDLDAYLKGEIQAGNITKEDAIILYNNKVAEAEASIASLINEEKARDIEAIAGDLLARGFSAEDTIKGIDQRMKEMGWAHTPDLTASLTTIGPEASKLWQEMMDSQKQAAKQEQYRQEMAVAPARRIEPEPQVEPSAKVPTGTEQQEFTNYVRNLSLAPQYQTWLNSQFVNLIDMWQSTPEKISFMEWLREYLQRGG